MHKARRSLFDNLLDRGPMLTPLIDIMFLVLVFFMVNNNPSQPSLGVSPPQMENAEQRAITEEQILLLAVRPDLSYSIQIQSGNTVLDERQGTTDKAALTGLREQLAALQQPQIKRIRLRADQKLNYGTIIAICEILYTWGLPLELDVSSTNFF